MGQDCPWHYQRYSVHFFIQYLSLQVLFTHLFAAEEHTGSHTLPQQLDIINFRQRKMLRMLDHLCEHNSIEALIPSTTYKHVEVQ